MRSYKLKFSRYEMSADTKAKGDMKKIIQRQVRRQLNKEAKKEIECRPTDIIKKRKNKKAGT